MPASTWCRGKACLLLDKELGMYSILECNDGFLPQFTTVTRFGLGIYRYRKPFGSKTMCTKYIQVLQERGLNPVIDFIPEWSKCKG